MVPKVSDANTRKSHFRRSRLARYVFEVLRLGSTYTWRSRSTTDCPPEMAIEIGKNERSASAADHNTNETVVEYVSIPVMRPAMVIGTIRISRLRSRQFTKSNFRISRCSSRRPVSNLPGVPLNRQSKTTKTRNQAHI